MKVWGVVFGPGLIRSPSSDPLEAMAKGDAERGFVENLFEKLEIEDDGGAFFFTAEKAEKLMKEGRDKESEGAGEGGEEPPLVFGENEAKDGDEDDEESEKEKKKLNLSRSLSKNIRRTGTVSKTSSNVGSFLFFFLSFFPSFLPFFLLSSLPCTFFGAYILCRI